MRIKLIMNSPSIIDYNNYIISQYIKDKVGKCTVFYPNDSKNNIDFVLQKFYNSVNKFITIQVKSSKCYFHDENDKYEYKYNLWFNRFKIIENVDWFLLCGIYPNDNEVEDKSGVNIKRAKWNNIILAFTYKELEKLFSDLKLKKKR